jgi:DNA (cytosine-5)-methyltransferase 1
VTLTLTDFFCGAGGSTSGAILVPGLAVTQAANHWALALLIHNTNHPSTDHAHVDLHQEDPRYFASTDFAWFSPECTTWTCRLRCSCCRPRRGAVGRPARRRSKQRSRMLMFDVIRFVEHHRYRAGIVENVVDVATRPKYRHAFALWLKALQNLGYETRIISLNSMHAQAHGMPAPQSRDRLYVGFWRKGDTAPDFDSVLRPHAWCPKCDRLVESHQAWKPGRTVGRYRQQYLYACTSPGCGTIVEPGWLPAYTAIDWSIPLTRIGDRTRPLAEKTRRRIAAGIARYWGPIHLEAAGQTYDAADPKHVAHGDPNGYYRSWSTDEVLRALHGTASKALAVPSGGTWNEDARPLEKPHRTLTTREHMGMVGPPFMLERRFEYRARSLDDPMATLTANDTSKALVSPFIAELRGGGSDARSVAEALATICANGNHHALVAPYYGTAERARPVDDPLGTLTTRDRFGLVMTNNHGNRCRPTDEELPTVTTATTQALLMRNNTARGDQGQMSTPIEEVMRTLTTAGHQSLITREDIAAAEAQIDDCGFRMLEPVEAAAGMAFSPDYAWDVRDEKGKLPSKRNKVKMAGNSVTPPASRDLLHPIVAAYGGAA